MSLSSLRYAGGTQTELPSEAIWASCPKTRLRENYNEGAGFFDNFLFAPMSDAALLAKNGYDIYGDTGVLISGMAGEDHGIIVETMDTDNDEAVLSTNTLFYIPHSPGADGEVWFEACVARESVTDNDLGMFVGLAGDNTSGTPATVANTLCLTDDDSNLGDFSYLGFHVDAANGNAVDFVVAAEGGADTVIKAGVCVPTAGAYNKLGFHYSPNFPAAKRIKIYVDGEEQSTYVTATQIAAATFPGTEYLGAVLCVKRNGSNDKDAYMKWWGAFQSW